MRIKERNVLLNERLEQSSPQSHGKPLSQVGEEGDVEERESTLRRKECGVIGVWGIST